MPLYFIVSQSAVAEEILSPAPTVTNFYVVFAL